MKGWRGVRGSRGTRPNTGRPLQHMRVYARGHRPNVVYMRCSKIRARSNAHNSLQFRPFSTKKILSKKAFRDATRGDAPEAVAPQIRLISVFFHETHSVTTVFDETWCVKKSSPRRICMQSLGQIRENVQKIIVFLLKSRFLMKNHDF